MCLIGKTQLLCMQCRGIGPHLVARGKSYGFSRWEKLHFDVLFVGDDWFKTERWQEMEKKFAEVGVRVVYFPYTKGTSSTLLSATLKKLREGAAPAAPAANGGAAQ